jgi:hypothetical protein
MFSSSLVLGAENGKPWSRHCSLQGIPVDSGTEIGKRFAEFAKRCEPTDACILACTRNECGGGAGGCFHDCGDRSSYGPPETLANMYAARDARLCPALPN